MILPCNPIGKATWHGHLDHLACEAGYSVRVARAENEGLALAMLDAVQQAVIARDADDHIIYWNAFAERLFGWPAATAFGLSPYELGLVPDDLWQNREAIAARIGPEGSWSGEIVVKQQDGSRVPIFVTDSLVRDPAGQRVGRVSIAYDVSEQRRAAMDREQLAAIVTASEDAIIAYELDGGVVTSWNPAAERLYGYPAAEIVGGSGRTLTPPELLPEVRALQQRLRRGERIEHFETQRLHRDGHPIDVSISLAPLHDAAGTITAAASIARDITAQKKARRQLQESEQRFRSLFTHHPDAIFVLDADGCYTDLNPACTRLTGYSRDEVAGHPFGRSALKVAEGHSSIRLALGGTPSTFDASLHVRDGSLIPAQVTLVPIVVDGATVGVYGICKNMTERKRAEAKLAMHARRQTAIAELGLLALTDIPIDQLLCTAMQLVAAELEVDVDVKLLPDAEDAPSAIATRLPGRDHENGVLLAFPRPLPARALEDDDLTFLQAVANVLGAAIDQKATADALHRREQEFKVLVEHAPDNIVRMDDKLRFMYVNPAVERMVGAPASSMIGQTNRTFGVPEPELSIWERALRRVFRTGEEDELELTYSTPTGERYFQVRLSPEFGEDGTVNSVLGVGREITVNKQREAERAQLYQELLERDSRLHQLIERVLLNQSGPNTPRVLTATSAGEHFTPRERQILRLLARGLTNREIGREINLRPSTVKNYIANLLPRLNATDRTQAAVHAAVTGLVNIDGD